MKKADGGDQQALAITREMMDRVPAVCEVYGSLASAAEDALVSLYAGRSAVRTEALRRTLAEMRRELAGPDASPLEKLLVQRVVACWLQSYHADFAYAQAVEQLPPRDVEPYQRRQDRAARQYLRSLKSLAEIRRLLVAQVQLNVADQQVNIAVGGDAPLSSSGQRDRGTP